MSTPTTPDNRCLVSWPLDDPNEVDAAAGRAHHCILAPDHDEDHTCGCGATYDDDDDDDDERVGAWGTRGWSVANQGDYARTYDEDEMITVRRGDVRAVLDVATMSMDFGSGFLDNEQVEALRTMAAGIGIDPIVVTPANFVCQYTGKHKWVPQSGYYYISGPQSVDGRRVALEQQARYDELVGRLTAAKELAREDRGNTENMAALEVLKQEALAFRNEIRAERPDPSQWDMEKRPSGFERCVLCGTTRPLDGTLLGDDEQITEAIDGP